MFYLYLLNTVSEYDKVYFTENFVENLIVLLNRVCNLHTKIKQGFVLPVLVQQRQNENTYACECVLVCVRVSQNKAGCIYVSGISEKNLLYSLEST